MKDNPLMRAVRALALTVMVEKNPSLREVWERLEAAETDEDRQLAQDQLEIMFEMLWSQK